MYSTLLDAEIKAVIGDGGKGVHFSYRAELHVGETIVDVLKVNYINVMGDYGSNVQDDISASFTMTPTTYQEEVYPYRDDLMVHLIRFPIAEHAGESTGIPLVFKLRCFLKNEIDLLEGGATELSASRLDKMGPIDVEVALIEKVGLKLRHYQVGGNWRDMTPAEAMACIARDALVMSGGEPNVDIREADNKTKRPVIVVPHVKMFDDVPHYLQDDAGGIYNAGIRMYFRRGTSYIFPKYSLGKKPGNRKVLTIVNIPKSLMPGLERTYRETDYQVIVLSTGDSNHHDDTRAIELNEGNGIRFTDANQVLDGMVSVSGNKAVMRRGPANAEFIDEKTGRGDDFAPMSGNRVTANPYAEVSRLAARKGVVEQFVWENADPWVIFPGMDVKVLYVKDGHLYERTGSLVGGEFNIKAKSNFISNNNMMITGALSVFSERKPKMIV